MESGMSSSKEKQVIVDIDIDEKDREAQVNRETIPRGSKRGKRSSDKLASGALNYNGEASAATTTTTAVNSGGSFEKTSEPTLELLVDKNLEEQQRLIEKGREKERRKAGKVGKVKKAAKPPRPPNGPTLSAADLRLIDELARMAMIKKRERIERAKALKMMQASKGSQLPPMPISSAHGATVFAMVITVVFLLVIIFQGFVSNNGSGLSPTAAPQPAPYKLVGTSPLQFYKTVSTDDGSDSGFSAAPSRPTGKASQQTGNFEATTNIH